MKVLWYRWCLGFVKLLSSIIIEMRNFIISIEMDLEGNLDKLGYYSESYGDNKKNGGIE